MKHKKILLIVMIVVIFSLSLTANAAKVSISKKRATISAGETLWLKVRGFNGKVRWSSSRKSIASVNEYGLVSGKKAGTTIIKAKAKGKVLKCKIKVIVKQGDLFPDGQPILGDGNIMLRTSAGTSENGFTPVIYLPKNTYTTPVSVYFDKNKSTNPFWIYLDGVLISTVSIPYLSSSSQDLYSDDYRCLKAGTHRVDVVQYENANPTLPVVLHRLFYYQMIRT